MHSYSGVIFLAGLLLKRTSFEQQFWALGIFDLEPVTMLHNSRYAGGIFFVSLKSKVDLDATQLHGALTSRRNEMLQTSMLLGASQYTVSVRSPNFYPRISFKTL